MAWRGNKNKRCGDAEKPEYPGAQKPQAQKPQAQEPGAQELGPKNLGPKNLGPKKMRPLSDAATDGDRWGA